MPSRARAYGRDAWDYGRSGVIEDSEAFTLMYPDDYYEWIVFSGGE